MKNKILKTGIILLFIYTSAYGQIESVADKVYVLDTLKINSFSLRTELLLSISDAEMDKVTDIKGLAGAHFSYLFRRTDVELVFRQILEQKDDATIITT